MVFERGERRVRPCREHGEIARTHLKLGIDGKVWVTPDDTRLAYCRDCALSTARRRHGAGVLGAGQAVMLLLSAVEVEHPATLRSALTCLGPGVAHEGSVYLGGSPPRGRIPDHLYDGGVFFVDDAELAARRERATAAFDRWLGRE